MLLNKRAITLSLLITTGFLVTSHGAEEGRSRTDKGMALPHLSACMDKGPAPKSSSWAETFGISKLSMTTPWNAAWTVGSQVGKVLQGLGSLPDRQAMVKFGLYGLAIYSSLPVCDALSTPVFGTPFQLNQNPIYQAGPVAVLSNGAIVSAWPNTAYDIKARIFDPNGTAITNEFGVSVTTPSRTPAVPVIAGLTGGNWVAAWTDSISSILARIFSPTGVAITAPFTPNQVAYQGMGVGSVTGLTNGNVLIVWGGSSPGNYAIPGRIFSPGGLAITNEFIINPYTSNLQSPEYTASLTDGSSLVTWLNSLSTTNNQILGRIVYANGTFGGNEFGISQTTITSTYFSSSIAGLSGGNAMVVYSTGSSKIFGRLIQNGAPVGNEFAIVNGTTQGDYPKVATLTSGNALTVWQAMDPQTLNSYIRGMVLSPSGVALTSAFDTPAYFTGANFMTSLTNGNALITWQDAALGGIYGQVISFVTTTDAPTTTSAPTTTVSPTFAPTTASPTTAAPTIPGTTGTTTSHPTTTNPTSGLTSTPTSTSTTANPTRTTTYPTTIQPTTMQPTTTATHAPTNKSIPSSAYSLRPPRFIQLPVDILSGVMGGVFHLAKRFLGS